MRKNTQRSSDSAANKLIRQARDAILGPGVQERIKKAKAMPIKFPGNDGIRYDPNWQDDIEPPKGSPK